MAARYCYDHPRPAVTADICLFATDRNGDRLVLLVRRANPPFAGKWALPGGFLDAGSETLAQCAARELKEETGISGISLTPFGVYSDPVRDPRGHVISTAFFGLISGAPPVVDASSDAAGAAWVKLSEATGLAFDHAGILADAIAAVDGGASSLSQDHSKTPRGK